MFKRIAFIITGIILAGLLTYKALVYCCVLNTNYISVVAASPLDAAKVKIIYGMGMIAIDSPYTDADLLRNSGKETLVYNGHLLQKPVTDYGENDFLVIYNGLYYFAFRHFIFNWRYQHSHTFSFRQRGNDVILKVDIKGTDDMSFERVMIPVSAAPNHRANTPIDSAGDIFNMTGMEK